MGQIRENLILTDEFSASFARFLQMGEQAAHRMERLGQSNEEFARSAAGMSSEFARSAAGMSKEIEHMRKLFESLPKENPLEWKAFDAPEVIKSAGMQRTFQEVYRINDALEKLTSAQYQITQQANETQILSPEASYDVQMVENRLAAMQEEIRQIESNPLNLGTDAANGALEQMHFRLRETMVLQEELNRAMQGSDMGAMNEAYLRLSQNISDTERYLRDSFSHIPPVEIPVIWQTEAIPIFTNSGIERFRQEITEANSMLNQLNAAQNAITTRAADSRIFPPGAVNDLSAMSGRIDAIRQQIQRMEANPLDMGTEAANNRIEQLRERLSQAVAEQNRLTQAVEDMDVSAANEAYRQLQRIIGNTERYIRDNRTEQQDFNREISHGAEGADKLARMIKNAATAYLSIHTLKSIIGLSDQMVSTTARLCLMLTEMNDELQTTESLQEMIYRSAQRARGSYQATADAVAKLGLMAGNAFSNSAEVVAFMEQINKQFRIAGTESAGIQAAMLQLTQAMASGVLRGEEYNSILEQAPNIIQNIAKYIEGNEEVLKGVAKAMKMGIDDLAGNVQKNLKDIASEGIISAELVKAAMFAAAEDTDEKFESMPETFSEVWEDFQNRAVSSLQPILGVFNDVANSAVIGDILDGTAERMEALAGSEELQAFIDGLINGMDLFGQVAFAVFDLFAAAAGFAADNWSDIAPILWGIAAAAGAVAIAKGIMAAADWAATAANDALVVSLLSNPLTWIAVGVALIVTWIYRWIQSVGGITVAWLMAKNAVLTVWDELQIGVMTGVFAVQNWMDSMHLKTATVGVNIANAIGDMKVKVLTHIESMVNGAIGLLNSFIGMLNKIPGVAISAIDKVTFSASAAASNEAAKSARESELSALSAANAENEQARRQHLDTMRRTADRDRMERLAGIATAKAGADSAGENASGGSSSEFSDLMRGAGMPSLGGKTADIGKVGSVGNVKNIEGEISLSDEDAKLYRDLAERRYMNQIELKTLAPVITVNLPAGSAGNMNPEDVANVLKKMLIEQMGAHTAISHG